jgi:hypothetical protein
MKKNIVSYLDTLEHRIRRRLSRYPFVYLVLGIGIIVLFWRGVWLTADEIALIIPESMSWMDGPLSVAVSIILLLGTALFISFLASDQIIIPDVRQDIKTVK